MWRREADEVVIWGSLEAGDLVGDQGMEDIEAVKDHCNRLACWN